MITGDAAAWQQLAHVLSERIQSIARSHKGLRTRGLAGSADDLSEVVTATLERLARDDYKNLRRFAEQRDREGGTPQSFESWLYGAVDYTLRDHLRKRYGRAPRRARVDADRPQPSKRDINSNAGALDEARFDATYLRVFGMTVKLTVAEIFAYVDREFSAAEAEAMHRYYEQDQGFQDIAAAIGLDSASEAEKLIRRLNARLRYKFEG